MIHGIRRKTNLESALQLPDEELCKGRSEVWRTWQNGSADLIGTGIALRRSLGVVHSERLDCF